MNQIHFGEGWTLIFLNNSLTYFLWSFIKFSKMFRFVCYFNDQLDYGFTDKQDKSYNILEFWYFE